MTNRRGVILLGASNLVRGISTAVQTARQCFGVPVDVFAALGHGRSYGIQSNVLGRSLPAIRECGLWEQLEQGSQVVSGALVTDVGNDLLYGASVPQVTRWVEECLQRLLRHSQQATISGLPLGSLSKLGRRRFALLRTILFPKSKLDYDAAQSAAHELDNVLRKLAEKYGTDFVAPDDDWFGFDPIHIKRKKWKVAWNIFFSSFDAIECDETVRTRALLNLRLRFSAPQQRWWFGISQSRQQPVWKWKDGTRIFFY